MWVATVGDSRAVLLDQRRVLYLDTTPAPAKVPFFGVLMPIGSRGLVYLPTEWLIFYGKCG